MSKYKVFNIVDMADAIGEIILKQLLSDFYCHMFSFSIFSK